MFRNLVFEGGGVKGIAYVGAMEVLEREGVIQSLSRVGGTSAGAINAVLAALRYTPDEMFAVLKELNFREFMDDSWGVIRDLDRLTSDFGWYKGDFFHKWISDLIAAKIGNPRATFKDLADMDYPMLYITGTNLTTGFTEVFSAEHTPRKRIADATRISMSIPFFFRAVRSDGDDVYVDGGVLANYPVKLFDREKYVIPQERERAIRKTDYYSSHNKTLAASGRTNSPYVYNKQTLGFRLDSGQEVALFRDGAEPARREVNNFFDYSWAIVSTFIDFQNSVHLHSDDWQRTVYIDSGGVKATDFDLSDEVKQNLVRAGRTGAERYFEWYETEKPVNHPDTVSK